MKILPKKEIRYVPTEVPPGIHTIVTTVDSSGEVYGTALVQCDKPQTFLLRQYRHNSEKGLGVWKNSYESDVSPKYFAYTWWRRLFWNIHKPAVPHARVVTR